MPIIATVCVLQYLKYAKYLVKRNKTQGPKCC